MKRYCDICEEKEGSFNWTSEHGQVLLVCEDIECHMKADEVVEEIYERYGEEGE